MATNFTFNDVEKLQNTIRDKANEKYHEILRAKLGEDKSVSEGELLAYYDAISIIQDFIVNKITEKTPCDDTYGNVDEHCPFRI